MKQPTFKLACRYGASDDNGQAEGSVGQHSSLETRPSRRQALGLPRIASQSVPIILQQREGVNNLVIKLRSREPAGIDNPFLLGAFRPAGYAIDNLAYHPCLAHLESGAHEVFDNNNLLGPHRNSCLLFRFSDNCLDNIFIIMQSAARAYEVGSSAVVAVSDQKNRVIMEGECSCSYPMWLPHVIKPNLLFGGESLFADRPRLAL